VQDKNQNIKYDIFFFIKKEAMLKISAQSEQLLNLVVKGSNGQEDNIFWFQLFMDALFEAKTIFFRIRKDI
jgi:hypothetical protein